MTIDWALPTRDRHTGQQSGVARFGDRLGVEAQRGRDGHRGDHQDRAQGAPQALEEVAEDDQPGHEPRDDRADRGPDEQILDAAHQVGLDGLRQPVGPSGVLQDLLGGLGMDRLDAQVELHRSRVGVEPQRSQRTHVDDRAPSREGRSAMLMSAGPMGVCTAAPNKSPSQAPARATTMIVRTRTNRPLRNRITDSPLRQIHVPSCLPENHGEVDLTCDRRLEEQIRRARGRGTRPDST